MKVTKKVLSKVLPKCTSKILQPWMVLPIDPILALGPLFYTNYTTGNKNAIYAAGSGVGTFGRDTAVGPDYATKVTGSDDSDIVTVTADDEPRFTSGYYDSTGYTAGRGLSLERATTNMLDDYCDLSASSGDATFVTGKPSPFGSDKGVEVTFVTAGDLCSSGSFLTTFNIDYNFSFYIKKGTKTTLQVVLFEYRAVPLTINYTQIFANVLATASTDEWQKYEGTVTAQDSADVATLMFRDTTGEIDKTVEICGLQVTEASPYTTTIPSAGAAAMTRNVESLTYPATSNYTIAEGTVAIAYRPNILPTQTPSGSIAILNIISGSDYMRFRYSSTGLDRLFLRTNKDGGSGIKSIGNLSLGWTDRNELHVIVATYKNGEKLNLYIDDDAALQSTGNYETLSTSAGTLTLGESDNNINVKSVATFADKLDATQVAELIRLMRL